MIVNIVGCHLGSERRQVTANKKAEFLFFD